MKKITLSILTILVLSSCALNSQIKKEELGEKEIIAKIIKAKGGKSRLEKVKTFKMITESSDSKSISYQKKPDKSYVKIEFPSETYTLIFNGISGIETNSKGTQKATGALLSSMKSDATIFPELYTKELQLHFKYFGIVKIDGKDMHKVKLSFPNRSDETNYYDSNTWLLYKKTQELGLETFYYDYKEIEGIQLFTSYKDVINKDTFYSEIKEMEINPEIDDSIFKID